MDTTPVEAPEASTQWGHSITIVGNPKKVTGSKRKSFMVDMYHGSYQDWESGKTWKNGKAFSSQGKVREFCQDWKSQGILPKILEKQENLN